MRALSQYIAPRPPTWLEIAYPAMLTVLFAWIFIPYGIWWPGAFIAVAVYPLTHALDAVTDGLLPRDRAGPFARVVIGTGIVIGALALSIIAAPVMVGVIGGFSVGFGLVTVAHTVGVATWFGTVEKPESLSENLIYTPHTLRPRDNDAD